MAASSILVAADPAVDLAVADTLASELEAYLVGDQLYRTVFVQTQAGRQSLQMTGGELLARLYRLQHDRANLSPAQQTKLDEVQQRTDTTIYSLRTRFRQRLQREAKARLSSLKWFLDDCRSDRHRCRVEFPFEIRNRQRLEEILKELDYKPGEELETELHAIDGRIRAVASASDFIWDERLRPIFPLQPYWYLYMLP